MLCTVFVRPDMKHFFQALQYKKDGEVCVVTGPITKPRKLENERLFHVESNLIHPSMGCLVIFCVD
jgi:hypothetical protein